MKEVFIQACHENDPSIFLNSLSPQESKQDYKYHISNTCRHCNKENIDDVHYAYWNAGWFPVHKTCKSDLMKYEAYECQLIDADCNDCKYYQRVERTKQKDVSKGLCLKFNKPVTARVNFASGYDCFEHRRG